MLIFVNGFEEDCDMEVILFSWVGSAAYEKFYREIIYMEMMKFT
jgi:hypothetical protein